MAAVAVLISFGAFERIYFATRAYESWELDETFSLFIVAPFTLSATLLVYVQRLRFEMSRRREAEALLKAASRYDQLTGVANRALFREQLQEQLASSKVRDCGLVIFVLDIDRFMEVNESCGHEGGDLILQVAAERLRSVMDNDDVIARRGGDEFALLMPGEIKTTSELLSLATRVLSVMREPYECTPRNDRPIRMTASIGISRYPGDATTAGELLLCAEAALNAAKAGGGDQYALYDRNLDLQRRQRLEVEAGLRIALERGEIVAYYQPLVDLISLKPVGFEALARWIHPEQGLIGPDVFIPVAEDTGLIKPLLTQMLERICEDTRNWDPALTISVNLSPSQLLDQHLVLQILGILAKRNFPPSRLEIEVTETAVLADFDAARQAMSTLKTAGMRMSLDDFGTGYSGLRHLQELSFDKIKIDGSFTRRIMHDLQCRKIISSMLGLGSTLGLTTVAEGIEHQEEERWLRRMRCHLGQGYLFAKPMPPQEALAYLERTQGRCAEAPGAPVDGPTQG